MCLCFQGRSSKGAQAPPAVTCRRGGHGDRCFFRQTFGLSDEAVNLSRMIRDLCMHHHLSKLASSYDVILSDIWGVLHNGVTLYPDAVRALIEFRQRGGSVVLISNASRLSPMVASQLEQLGLPLTGYDRILTSGDVTRDFFASRLASAVFDVGPGDARPILKGMDIRFTGVETADFEVSSGAVEGTAKLEDFRRPLSTMYERDLLLVCANPDIVTNIGEQRVYCSGAVAELYKELGGKVVYAGKPQAPIYERALLMVEEIRGDAAKRERVLVIGDSLRTDIVGAIENGFDSLFVTDGIHAKELDGSHQRSTNQAVRQLLAKVGVTPTKITRRLVW